MKMKNNGSGGGEEGRRKMWKYKMRCEWNEGLNEMRNEGEIKVALKWILLFM